MRFKTGLAAATIGLALAMALGNPAAAQKRGGVLKMYFFDSPASMSIHEEATIAAQGPMMGVFNNLVMYRQDVPLASLESIVPDLASEWSWDEDKTALTFKLRQGVKWHDGKPFTAKDVKCTWDMLQGKTADKLRLNPRKPWYGYELGDWSDRDREEAQWAVEGKYFLTGERARKERKSAKD